MKGYDSNFISRQNKRGGGVGIYVKNKYKYRLLEQLSNSKQVYDSNTVESIFIEVENSRGKNTIVGCIYNPPGMKVDTFNKYMTEILFTFKEKPAYLCGEFNINLLNYKTHNDTNEFYEVLTTQGYYSLITHPTRITTKSATLIDNIFTNVLDNGIHSGLIVSDISDHLPVFSVSDSKSYKTQRKVVVKKRIINSRKIELFKKEFNDTSWDKLSCTDDPNEQCKIFYDFFLKLYNKCFPLQKVKQKSASNKPWFSTSLQNCCKKKNHLYKVFLAKKDTISKQNYKVYKNKLTSILRKAERKYYSNKFIQLKGNIKSTWQVLKGLINKKSKSNNSSLEFKHNSSVLKTPHEIANAFNEYFVTIGPNLEKSIAHTNTDPVRYIKGNFLYSMFLSPIYPNEVYIMTMKEKCNKAAGFDDITINIVKSIAEKISEPLSCIFNASLKTDIFPDILKTAKIIHLYKAGDKNLLSNYRPISVLSVFAKIVSKLNSYGICGLPYQWIKSYLSNRQHYVIHESFCSSLLTVQCGVLQGFILGPLLFIIYINYVCSHISTI